MAFFRIVRKDNAVLLEDSCLLLSRRKNLEDAGTVAQ